MIFNRSIDIVFSKEDQQILDGQSKICNWLYNQLLDQCVTDHRDNNNERKLLSGRNLRDQVPVMKKEHAFLEAVYSSPLKNTAFRLKDAYGKFFKEGAGYPKFRAWKKKWFSLFYDEPNKGFAVDGKSIELSLGVNEEGKRLHVKGLLQESLKLQPGWIVNTFRLCKKQKTFYGVFTIEKADLVIPTGQPKAWIAIDPNHKNFGVGIDDSGVSVEFQKLKLIKYWDEVIDRLKSMRDLCERKNKQKTTPHGKTYFVPSKRWVRLDKALARAQQRRREQIKQACYSIAHFLAKHYDAVAIGDYIPSTETATQDQMHRSMLNQEVIGTFRKILAWVFFKSQKQYQKIDEAHTTSDCCACGDRDHKDPSVRSFVCKRCGKAFYRDINSAVNIALRANFLSGSDYIGWSMDAPMYTVYWSPLQCEIQVADAMPQKGVADELNQVGSSAWAKLV